MLFSSLLQDTVCIARYIRYQEALKEVRVAINKMKRDIATLSADKRSMNVRFENARRVMQEVMTTKRELEKDSTQVRKEIGERNSALKSVENGKSQLRQDLKLTEDNGLGWSEISSCLRMRRSSWSWRGMLSGMRRSVYSKIWHELEQRRRRPK